MGFRASRHKAAHVQVLGQRVRGDNHGRVAKKEALVRRQDEGASAKLRRIVRGEDGAERLQALVRRRAGKVSFSLADEDDGEAEIRLKGSELPVREAAKSRKTILNHLQDDYEDAGLLLSDDEQAERQLGSEVTGGYLFGTAGAAGDAAGGADAGASARKSRQEVLSELIARTKETKAAATQNKFRQAALLAATEESLQSVLGELEFKPERSSAEYVQYVMEQRTQDALHDPRSTEDISREADFEQLAKRLAHAARGHATDRVKTKAERQQAAAAAQQRADLLRQQDLRRAQALGSEDP